MSVQMRAGRFTGLTSVATLDLPPGMANEWTWGVILASNPHDPDSAHYYWRKWSEVDLDVFLLSLCGKEVEA